ncbi:hypothetical protein ACJ4V0_15560 [Phreatobacter sp. HK31-P]
MASRFEKYRLKDGDEANAERFNPILRDLDLRTAAVEEKAVGFDIEKAKFVTAGLARLDEIMQPITSKLTDYASLGAILTTQSASNIETGDGQKTFVVSEALRLQFAPSAYLAVIKTGDPSQAMLGVLNAYDPQSGDLTVTIDRFEGSGFHTGWTITAASATDNAAAIADVYAYKVDAETAAGQALLRKDEAAASAAAALASKNSAENDAETADDARNQAQIAQAATEAAKNLAFAYMTGFLGAHPSTTPPTLRLDGGALQVSDWYFKEVVGPPATTYIDYVSSVGPVVWRSLVAASDTSVTSFNGRVGGVNPVTSDYTAAMVDATAPAGLTGATVQAVLDAIGTAIALKADKAVTVVGGGLASGGGDISASRTITVTKSSNAQAIAGVDDTTAMTPVRVKDAIIALAPAPGASSETASGIVELATAAETITGTSTTLAIHPAGFKAAVDARFNALVGAAPGALDTLAELAAAIDNNASYASSITAALGNKLNSSALTAFGLAFVGLADAAAARTNLGLGTMATQATASFVAATRTVSGGGLVSGGGSLSADLTLTVTKSSLAQAQAGTDDTTAMTPVRTKDAITQFAALPATSISAGTGLSGGGSLAASRTLSFDVAWGDTRYALTGHTHAAATTSVAGFLSAADKTKLDGLVAGGPDYQAFTASGTWTKPAGLTGNEIVVIEAWGAGGGGGMTGGDGNGPGGGGGAYTRRDMRAADLPGTVSVTIGAGGAGRASFGGATNGGTTTFGSYVTAYGAIDRYGGTNIATIGNGHETPLQNIFFGGGGGSAATAAPPVIYGGGGGGTNASNATIRLGGVSMHGGAGGSGSASSGAAPAAGNAPGGGGGGGWNTTGGAGARGEVRVTVIRS